MYPLNDNYCLQLVRDSSQCLIIELYHHTILTRMVSLNNDQCLTLTHRLCETIDEFDVLIIDLLETSVSSIRVTADENLQISFPVRFGSRNYEKLWSFRLELQHLPRLAMNTTNEISLDPSDWNDLRLLGHKVMDNMIDYMRDIRQRPTWRPLPLTIKQTILNGDLPLQGQSPWQVYDEICTTILPYIIGNIHPLFWGHVYGTGSAIGALAEFITGTINTMSWGGQQASIYLERKVLSWLKLLIGFPNDETSSGILVSGTSVATIIALAVARKKFHERTMIIYCSKDTHSCIIRAANLLGINKENIVYASTNEQRQIDVQKLEACIDPNACGFIVGSAGTVGTGAIDDLQGLADICARRPNDLWFHVDGAIGAVACCSPRLRPLFKGLERADSIAFDLHKWLFVPYECGCILVRDGQLHRSTFAQPTVSYLTLMDGGITPSEGEHFFSDYGLELSRNTKAIKVWMTLKTYGIERLGRIMEQNVDQALYFAHLIEQHSSQFELLTKVTLNIVCFRYIACQSNTIDQHDKLNKFNKHLLIMIQERGIAVVSPYVIGTNTFALRMCITNHRTRLSDMDQFIEQMIQLACELLDKDEFAILKAI